LKIEKWPYYDSEQIESVSNILRSGNVNYWTGSSTKNFEKDFANWCGTKYALAVANGSLALEAAYKSLGFEKNDEIITTPRTFIATTSSAILTGLKPVFADVDFNSGNITPETIINKITKKTKAISVVHLGGWPADMPRILEIAKNYGLKVIEDCSQAHGASINVNGLKKSVGSFGDVSTWSFCQDKIMSTGGEGGMVTTNSSQIWDYIWSLKDHGKSFSLVNKENKSSEFRWLHENLGSNFRLTEMQSGIGSIQLKKIYDWNKKRAYNANILTNKLRDLPVLRIPTVPEGFNHAWYKYYCYLKPANLKSDWDRARILAEINNLGFPSYQGGCSEIYLEKIFKKLKLEPKKRLPNAMKLGETSLMFLVHPNISCENMHAYSEAVFKILKVASK